ncbi:hypothetical protein Tco_1187393, partial [Tanacetum coccineum]
MPAGVGGQRCEECRGEGRQSGEERGDSTGWFWRVVRDDEQYFKLQGEGFGKWQNKPSNLYGFIAPLPAAVSPIADSPGYVPESDHEEDPEEDNDKDHEEDPADYLADEGDDGDDEDESSDDDEDEDVDIEGDEVEDEHPAPVDSTVVALPAVDQALSADAATPPPHPAYRVTARISIRDETPISLPPREEVERLLAMPTPSSSPLSPWSSPLPQIPSPPLPVSSPMPVLSPSPPASPIRPLG